ncbi:MAG: ATP-binding protein [Acidobacteriaceae bacterium]|nr:ATP-binding protein [Acidobacteriaceae bacterium]
MKTCLTVPPVRGGLTIASRIACAVAIVCPVAFGLDPAQHVAQYGHQTWRTETGLPQNSVHAIVQSQDGFIWLGTEGGLVRFDGTHFLVYDLHNTPQLGSNSIRSIVEDADKALWVGTANGLARFQNGEVTRFSTKDGLPSNDIWGLLKDTSQRLWALSPDGVALYNRGRFDSYLIPSEYGPLTGAIAPKRGGALWLSARAGLMAFNNSSYTPAQADIPSTDQLDSILLDHAGHLWIGSTAGLFEMSETGTRRFTAKDGLPGKHIAVIHEDRNGTIWVGTDQGLGRMRDGAIEQFPANSPVSASAVLSIADDREGNLWVGTELDGVTMLRDQAFTAYTGRDGLPGDATRCLLVDSRGTLWIGTDGRALARMENGNFQTIAMQNGLSSNVILSLAEGADGSILAGTPDGLNKIQGDRISVITSADGLPDDFIRSIYRDQDGSLWIGTRRGLCHLEAGRFISYGQSNGLGSDLIGSMARDQQGNLWIATLHGLSLMRDGKFSTFTTKNGLSSDIITALITDPNGTLWIGTQDGGLNEFRNGAFFSFGSSSGLPEAIYGLSTDSSQGLWIASNSGIYRASTAQLESVASHRTDHVNVSVYGTGDGLPISECPSGGHPTISRGADGRMWFATLKGIAAANPGYERMNTVPPLVALERVLLDDRAFRPSSIRDIAPGHSRVSFEYAGLSFSSPYKVRYRYKLDGFDRDWIDAGTRTTAYYTNLPPRDYVFRVTAGTSDGFWNGNEATLPIRVEPHYYQEIWFKAAVVAALGLLVYAIYLWRLREAEARFNAVLQERSRIAREIHDTLAQGFIGVSVQLELVSRLLSSSLDAAREHLDQARIQVRESIGEARRAIWQLRSQPSERMDLPARLSKLAANAAADSSIRADVEVRGIYRSLPADVEDELLRIAQEAVTNAIRHGEPGTIHIDLAYESRRVRMTITDDGHGFTVSPDVPAAIGHYGLKGMRERAEQIDAKLTVSSTPGSGTVVSVEALVS